MPTLKPFYLGTNYSMPDGQARELLGEPAFRRSVRGLVVAASKAAAIALVEELRAQGQDLSPLYPHEMRVDTTPMVEHFKAAGLFTEPGMYLMAKDAPRGPVLKVNAAGFEIVGHIVDDGDPDSHRTAFDPVGTVHARLLPDAVAALRTLLARVPESAGRQELLDRLPAELRDGGPT